MKKLTIVLAMLLAGCNSKPLTDKEVCETDWQYLSNGTIEKCKTDRIIEAMKSNRIHDTVFISKP